jgi:hypothetical protein
MSVAAGATAAAPTRAEYIAELDPRCQKTDRKLDAPTDEFVSALERSDFKRAARSLGIVVDIYAKSLDRIANVEPPAADADRIARWLALEGKDVDVTRRMVDALEDSNPDRYNRLVDKSQALERRINATLRGYGFKHCN